ncbi:MAG: murein hydrolase activator EnvC family protein [Gemmatimonas sp.]
MVTTARHAAIAVAILAFAAPALARDEPPKPPAKPGPDRQLKSVEQELERTREQDAALAAREAALEKEIDALRGQLVEAAAAARQREQAVVEHRRELGKLEAEEQEKTIALDARRRQLSDLLMALARHARRPPEALVALPASPEDTIRAALLLAAAVPELEAEAASLRTEIEALDTVRKAGAQTRDELEKESRALARDRSRLESLVAQKSALQKQTQAERRKAQADADRLAREAHDIKELMERLEAERQARSAQAARHRPAPVPPPSHRGGTEVAGLPRAIAPVNGRIVAAFGARGDGGAANRGVTLEVAPGTSVLAPFSGRVVYAGPFRDYGQLLIIEHGEGYHLLLAGFGRIDSALGESVLAGEPIGIVGTAGGAATARGGSPSRIYLELRRNGRPIDPTPWLGVPTDKVSG